VGIIVFRVVVGIIRIEQPDNWGVGIIPFGGEGGVKMAPNELKKIKPLTAKKG
jgi:hypothetical protein